MESKKEKIYYSEEEIIEKMQSESLTALWLVTHRSKEEKLAYLEYCHQNNLPANSEESAENYMNFVESNL